MTERNPKPPAHHNAPSGTSDVAARMIQHVAPTLRGAILRAIREAGPDGLTDDEGERLTGIIPQTYTPRRGELASMGLVKRADRRRPTSRGRPAMVWVAAEHHESTRN